jgi:hypothetical protein
MGRVRLNQADVEATEWNDSSAARPRWQSTERYGLEAPPERGCEGGDGPKALQPRRRAPLSMKSRTVL